MTEDKSIVKVEQFLNMLKLEDGQYSPGEAVDVISCMTWIIPVIL